MQSIESISAFCILPFLCLLNSAAYENICLTVLFSINIYLVWSVSPSIDITANLLHR